MSEKPDYLQPAPRGMKELKRLFGAENVSEEFVCPPDYNRVPEKWCYVVTLPQDSPLFSHAPQTPFDYNAEALGIEGKFNDMLALHQCLDNDVAFNGELTLSQSETRRLIIPVEIVEEPDSVAQLSKISRSG